MNTSYPKSDVEKPPKTRTERHTRLYNEVVETVGNLKEKHDAALRLFRGSPLNAHVPLAVGDVRKVLDLLLALSRELKPDTKDGVA
jgi:hypothetical protein